MAFPFVSSDDDSVARAMTVTENPAEADGVDYRDFFHTPAAQVEQEIDRPEGKRRGPRGGVVVPFPVKLYAMLKGVEEEGLEHIVSWLPHGRCFMVHQPKVFAEDILPRFFKQTKLTSFQRQLNLYGFLRLNSRERGAYYHELFLRGRGDLPKIMLRTRVKRSGLAGVSSDAEPDFLRMSVCQYEQSTAEQSCAPTTTTQQVVAPKTVAPLQVSAVQTMAYDDDDESIISANDIEQVFSVFPSGSTPVPLHSAVAAIPPVVSCVNLKQPFPQRCQPLRQPPALGTFRPRRISEDSIDTGFFEGQRFRCIDSDSLRAFERALIRSD